MSDLTPAGVRLALSLALDRDPDQRDTDRLRADVEAMSDLLERAEPQGRPARLSVGGEA